MHGAQRRPGRGGARRNAEAHAATAKTRTLRQQLGDTSTAIMVQRMFPTHEQILDMVSLLYRPLSQLLAVYASSHNIQPSDARLIFKGGNLYSMYLVPYLEGLPQMDDATKATLQNWINKILGHSDLDFTLHLAQDLPDRDTHRRNINKLVMHALVLARRQLEPKLKDTLTSCWSAEQYKAVLDSTSVQVLGDGRLYPRSDFVILERPADGASPCSPHTKYDKDEKCSALLVPTDLDPGVAHDYLFISRNTLSWSTAAGLVHFDLIRMKLNVMVPVSATAVDVDVDVDVSNQDGKGVYAPSEVFDVTITHDDDYKNSHAPITAVHNHRGLDIHIYSLYYLIHHDLATILFLDNTWPWLDVKYAKRMKRYLLGLSALSVASIKGDAAPGEFMALIQMFLRRVLNPRRTSAPNNNDIKLPDESLMTEDTIPKNLTSLADDAALEGDPYKALKEYLHSHVMIHWEANRDQVLGFLNTIKDIQREVLEMHNKLPRGALYAAVDRIMEGTDTVRALDSLAAMPGGGQQRKGRGCAHTSRRRKV